MSEQAGGRVRERVGLRASPAVWVLVGLVVAGVVLRIVVTVSWWPASIYVADSWPYAFYAAGDPFASPQHPPGYSLFLAALGLVTRSLPIFVVVQQLMGIASALLLFAAVRRLIGSPWPALAPAVVVLLGADQLYVEHAILSEGLFLLLVSGALYAAVRAFEDSPRALVWAGSAAGLLGVASIVRSAGTFMLLALLAALLLHRPGALSWRPALCAAIVGVAVLVGYASTNLVVNDRFAIGPSPGWHLYSRTAQFADCDEFDPPSGTAALCEGASPDERPGARGYMFSLTTPGHRVFGAPIDPGQPLSERDIGLLIHRNLRQHDDELGAFGRAAVLHQPVAYASVVARDFARYWAPGLRTDRPEAGVDLSPQLDFGRSLPSGTATVQQGMQEFFDPFAVSRERGPIAFLADYQRVFRFGATLLSICTLLVLAGLLVGPRRARVGALLFGVGGILTLIPPVLVGLYSGRYTVPIAGPVAAGAAIGAWALLNRITATRAASRQVAD